MKATKKPVTIEFIKWDGENLEEVKNFVGASYIGGGNDHDKKIVELAKERDMVYDFIKEKEDELAARKEAKDDDSVSFIEADIKLLTDRKTLLTNRIKDLLDKT